MTTVHPKRKRAALESKGQRTSTLALVLLAATACLPPMDQRSNVHDLRVLGVSVESPELMAPFCVFDFAQAQSPAVQAALAVYSTPVSYTALIADPAGEGREISYELWACPSGSDVTCSREGEPRFLIKEGVTTAGELRIEGITPGLLGVDLAKLAQGDASGALLFEVLNRDPYRGLGGIRVPLRLHLEAGEEEIWASKLMVYSCNFFPQRPGQDPAGPTMKQNVTPLLPGMNVDGTEWKADEVRPLSGPGPFKLAPPDYKGLQEHYVVPSFELQPIELDESWEIAWHADLGRFSPQQTGGSDPGAGETTNESEWSPGSDAEERDVTFWFVVRDGRGGISWLTRRAHYTP